MTKTLTVTFDGKVLVPTTPVDLNANVPYLVTIQPIYEPGEIADDESITANLNRVYAQESSALDPVMAEIQWQTLRSLPKEDW